MSWVITPRSQKFVNHDKNFETAFQLRFFFSKSSNFLFFLLKTTMTAKQIEPAHQLVSQIDSKNIEIETSFNQPKDRSLKSRMDSDSRSSKPSLTISPLTKKWFRKQFGIRRSVSHLDDSGISLTSDNIEKCRRRSSSLPDLAAMLEAAANLKRHHSFTARSSHPS